MQENTKNYIKERENKANIILTSQKKKVFIKNLQPQRLVVRKKSIHSSRYDVE